MVKRQLILVAVLTALIIIAVMIMIKGRPGIEKHSPSVDNEQSEKLIFMAAS
jgi:hypothetical protein